MNKTNLIILSLIGIIVLYYAFIDKRVIEGLGGMGIEGVKNPKEIVEVPKDPSDPKNPSEPKNKKVPTDPSGCPILPPPEKKGPICPANDDPNVGLVKTCTNLVTNYANQCTANAAGLMTKAFGTKTTITPSEDKCNQHATDKKLLDFLKNMASKLSGLANGRESGGTNLDSLSDSSSSRRGITPKEYIQWKNVLSSAANQNIPLSIPTSGRPNAVSGSENVVINITDKRSSGGVSGGILDTATTKKLSGGKDSSHSDQSKKGGLLGSGDSYMAYNTDDYI